MSYSSVNIIALTNNDLGAPMPGVTVKVLSVDGAQVFGQACTGANGIASFLLPVQNYQLRLFQFGVNFTNPMLLELDDAVQNNFKVYGTPRVRPEATDPRLCLASGFFRDVTGAAQANVDMHFIAKFDPLLLEGSAILSERRVARTDAKGYAVVPLIRMAEYDVTLEGMENIYRSIEVPDTSSVNLPDLLFPVIEGVSFDGVVGGQISLVVGQEASFQGHVFTSDLRELDELGSDVAWSLSNPPILNFELRTGSILFLQALNPGSCLLVAARKDRSIIRIPNVPIIGAPITITVSAP